MAMLKRKRYLDDVKLALEIDIQIFQAVFKLCSDETRFPIRNRFVDILCKNGHMMNARRDCDASGPALNLLIAFLAGEVIVAKVCHEQTFYVSARGSNDLKTAFRYFAVLLFEYAKF